MKNAINWFEIPVKDFNRAKRFYEAVLQIEMRIPWKWKLRGQDGPSFLSTRKMAE